MIPTANKLYDVLLANLSPGEVVSINRISQLARQVTPSSKWKRKAIRELAEAGYLINQGDSRFKWNPDGKKVGGRSGGTKKEGKRGKAMTMTSSEGAQGRGGRKMVTKEERELIVSLLQHKNGLKVYAYVRWQVAAFAREITSFFGLQRSHTYRSVKKLKDMGVLREVGAEERGEAGEVANDKAAGVVGSGKPVFYTLNVSDPFITNTLDDMARDAIGDGVLESIKKHRWWEEKKEEDDEVRGELLRKALDILARKKGKKHYVQIRKYWAERLGVDTEEMEKMVVEEIESRKTLRRKTLR